MCHIFIYILLIFRLLCEVQTQDCEKGRYETLEASVNNECHTRLSGESGHRNCTYVCDDEPNVTNVVDVVKGTLISQFPLPPLDCGHNLYKVNLMINEQVQKESDCNENVTFTDKHSVREYKINRCENENCGGKSCNEYGEVMFNYIFTSCYKLRIETFISTHSRPPLYSCPFFITSNFTKLKIADIQPGVMVYYNHKENVCSVDVKYQEAISKSSIEIIFCENGSSVNWAEVSVKAGTDRNGSTCLTTPKVMEPTCSFQNTHLFERIQCHFYNIYPGNYCIRIKLTDDRCVAGTIWTANNTGCRWSHSFVTEDQPPNEPIIRMPIDSTLTAFLILLGVIAGGLLVVFLFCRRVPPSPSSLPHAESPEDVIRPMIEGIKVLLLYPRDCKDLMDTMECFRKLLETYNIEVYDCYVSDEVLTGPQDWLRRVMAYPKLRTIIVNSRCAYLQQQAIQMGCNDPNLYKNATFTDGLFLYGLNVIMNDISATYLKNFVVGFSGFSSDKDMLTLTTSFRRYCIPEHLPKLLVDMNLEESLENIQICSSDEYTELLINLKTLENYVKMEPQYLNDILYVV